LAVVITARTKAFAKGLGKARKRLRAFSKGVASMGKYTAGASIAAAAGLALIVKNSMATIDVQAKTAVALGTTTEALVGLQHAGSIAGVSNEEVNKSMGKMLKSVGQARQGLLAQKRAFELLGLSADTLAKTDPSEAMVQILGALDRVPNAADKAAAATDIFGRGGMKLIPMAKMGASGIKDLMKEAEKLGMTFSGKMAASVEEANDSLTRLWGVFKGAATTLTVKLAPYIQEASDRLRQFALSGEGLASKVGAAFDASVIFVRNFVEELMKSDSLMGSIIAKAKEMIATVAPFAGVSDVSLQREFDNAKKVIADYDKEIAKRASKAQPLADFMKYRAEKQKQADRMSKELDTRRLQKQFEALKGLKEWSKLSPNDKPAYDGGAGGGLGKRSGSFRQVAFSKAAVGGPGTTKTPIQADPAELTLLTSIRDLLKTNPTSVAVAG